MKRIIFTLSILFVGLSAAFAQTLVTTDVTNKNAVLEEYTGIHC